MFVINAISAFLIFITEVQSLKCYICSNQDVGFGCGHGTDVHLRYLKDCNDPAVADMNPELPPNVTDYTVCRKMITKVEFKVYHNKPTDNEGIIKRSCGYNEEKYVGECYRRAGLGGRVEVCTCKDKEGCNGTNNLSVGAAINLLIIFVIFTPIF